MSTPRTRSPQPYRLAARALRVAETIRRDHGDEKLADLLVALATDLQLEAGSARDALRGQESASALGNHTLRVALKALHEIATMSTDPAVVAKCHAVIGTPQPADCRIPDDGFHF